MSLFVLLADLHIRSSNPRYRIDDYETTLLKKVEFFIYICNKYNADGVIAGDIFHNILKVKFRTVNRLIRILKKCKRSIFTVAGQHDKEYHSHDLLPSPYLTLMESHVIVNLGKTPINNMYGVGWDNDLDDNIVVNDRTILVIHHTITPGDPAHFLTEGISAEDLMDMFPKFKYIVCGDYHVPHMTKKNGRILINCGSIGRSNSDQYNYEPCLYVLDNARALVRKIKIPIKPPEEVFRIPENKSDLDKEFQEQIENLVKFTTKSEERPNFINNVRKLLVQANCSERQKQIAEKFYNGERDA